ncbi:hypothetical protein EVAR_91490_1 [Eumeta japonica]|uniref:Uncharacterized protein n=1 Tax=Eumeta variegata TaxID=151549 RepID=A0A4C1VBE2_EUMVA|nr:hypothetical protein EVAR_91490_1 [Eumeta japonica]
MVMEGRKQKRQLLLHGNILRGAVPLRSGWPIFVLRTARLDHTSYETSVELSLHFINTDAKCYESKQRKNKRSRCTSFINNKQPGRPPCTVQLALGTSHHRHEIRTVCIQIASNAVCLRPERAVTALMALAGTRTRLLECAKRRLQSTRVGAAFQLKNK